MKDKMEITIGICIGSSIVSSPESVHSFHISSCIANCCFRHSVARDYWLDVSVEVPD